MQQFGIELVIANRKFNKLYTSGGGAKNLKGKLIKYYSFAFLRNTPMDTDDKSSKRVVFIFLG